MLVSSTAVSLSLLVCLPVYAANTAEGSRQFKAKGRKWRDVVIGLGPLCLSGNVSEMLCDRAVIGIDH